MKRIFGALMALLVAGGALVPAAAQAQPRHYSHYYSYGHHDHGDAVAAGVIGLALGAIIGSAVSNSHRHRCYDRCGYYDNGYYGDGYYRQGYYDGGYGGGGPALCIVREQRWDPYTGRPIFIEERRPC